MFSLKSVKKQSCLKFFPTHNVVVDQFIMVNSCPLGADDQSERLCLAGKTLPVYDENKFLYKNKYCAICNKAESYQFPDVRVGCVEKPPNGKIVKEIYSSECHL